MRGLPTRTAAACLLAALSLLSGPGTARARRASLETQVLGAGQAWETRVTVREGARPGPTVMIVGGQHGNEPAGAAAADQIRHWPIRRGRLVVLPRANVRALAARKRHTPGVARDVQNLNRNFPRLAADASRDEDGRAPVTDPARGEVAPAVWKLVETWEPDWLLDLHEGFAAYAVDPDSCGHSVIFHPDQADARVVADLMIEAVNETIPESARHFVRLKQITRSTLARSTADHLGTRSLILETCFSSGPLSRRTRRHRVMVFALLHRLGMLVDGVDVETVLPAEREPDRVRVALYDAEGTGGPGVPRAHAQVGGAPHTTVVRVCPEDVRGGALDAFDVVVFTGGSGSRQGRALGEVGRDRVREFVRGGGGFVGVCAGAYLALSDFGWSLGLLDARTVSPKWRRGRGVVEIAPTPAGRTALDLPEGAIKIRYGNGPVFQPFGSLDVPDYEVWARYRTELAEGGAPRGIMIDSPAIAAGAYGAGRVVVLGPHPEQTKGLETVLPRAVRWSGSGGAPRR
jgi:predicted deacylase